MQRREVLGLAPGDTDPFYDSIDVSTADDHEVDTLPQDFAMLR